MKCPKCGKEHERLLALSRRDNQTQICVDCGVLEALEDAGFPETLIQDTIKKIRKNRRRNR